MQFNKQLFPDLDLTRPIVISGPCSAETQEQVLSTARQLCERGIRIFRAGIWKPRTRPGAFEGVGNKGLAWLKLVKEQTGMYTCTEVASAQHVYEAVKYGVDLLWIGARSTVNPFLMQEIADAVQGLDIPVLVKNPVNPDLELWVGAIERLYKAGIRKMGVIHRGFSSWDKQIYRNTPHWNIPIELRRRFPDLLMFCDPSHMGGKRELISPLSQHATDRNYDGLFIESHLKPDTAQSDAWQQITPDVLQYILKTLVVRQGGKPDEEKLSVYRAEIDEYDDELVELISKRMKVSRLIGIYKKENNIQVLQAARYNEIIEERIKQAASLGIKGDCMLKILESIHEESVRLQIEIMNMDNLNPSEE